MKRVILLLISMIFLLSACGDSHLYDNVISADGYAVIEADSAEVTKEALTDVYFNYFDKQENLDYLIIVYKDNNNRGAYMSKGFVLNDTRLTVDANDNIVLGDDSEATMYIPSDGELK